MFIFIKLRVCDSACRLSLLSCRSNDSIKQSIDRSVSSPISLLSKANQKGKENIGHYSSSLGNILNF